MKLCWRIKIESKLSKSCGGVNKALKIFVLKYRATSGKLRWNYSQLLFLRTFLNISSRLLSFVSTHLYCFLTVFRHVDLEKLQIRLPPQNRNVNRMQLCQSCLRERREFLKINVILLLASFFSILAAMETVSSFFFHLIKNWN